jgi:hypothetical protein
VGMNRVARVRSPIHITEDQIFVVSGLWPHHQFFEGHFFYLRDPLRIGDVWDSRSCPPLEKCFKLACLAEIFGQIEYAFEILDWIAASPEAASVAAATRQIIDEGAQNYRQASASGTPASNETQNDDAEPPATSVEEASVSAAPAPDETKNDEVREAAANTSLHAGYRARFAGMLRRLANRISEHD